MNKGLVFRMGQQHGPRYIPRLLEHVRKGEVDPSSFLMTHPLGLEEGPRGYALFRDKLDACVRAVFDPRVEPPVAAAATDGAHHAGLAR